MAGTLVGCNTLSNSNNREVNKTYKNKKKKNKNTADKETSNSHESEVENAVRDIVGENIDNLGFYYYEFGSGSKVAINEDKVFKGASTTKVALAMMIMDAVQRGEVSMNDKIEYIEEDYEDGTGILLEFEKIEPLTIEKLIELSIVYSDNIATNMLYRATPYDRGEYIESFTGIPITKGVNEITAKQQFLILKRLYENEENNPYYKDLINLLKNTEFHERIDKYIPQEISAHKIGTNEEYIHDVGIIYTDKPYILVMYTVDMGGEEEAEEILAEISEKIYEINISL